MTSMKGFRAAGFLLLALGFSAATLGAETVRNHFDADSMGRAPGFFDFEVLGAPGTARWLVLSDVNPPSAPHILQQVDENRPAGSIAAAVRRTYVFRDGTVSTYVRRGPGHAGMILRLVDARNFLVLLVDTATGSAVLTSYRGGKSTELGRGQAALNRSWEQFTVTAAGPSLSVLFDGKKLFEATDPNPATGRTGLATAGPGVAAFDEFILESAETAKP
jgi:hypothetical protein